MRTHNHTHARARATCIHKGKKSEAYLHTHAYTTCVSAICIHISVGSGPIGEDGRDVLMTWGRGLWLAQLAIMAVHQVVALGAHLRERENRGTEDDGVGPPAQARAQCAENSTVTHASTHTSQQNTTQQTQRRHSQTHSHFGSQGNASSSCPEFQTCKPVPGQCRPTASPPSAPGRPAPPRSN